MCEDKKSYIEIENADKDKKYYCPCCGGIVYPKAVDSIYIKPHFCHRSNSCSGEDIKHFIAKWEFTKRNSIPTLDLKYEKVEIEKEYKTSFGIYRPDVILHLNEGKVVFVEIKNTSKKSSDYIFKWDELGNDVIEYDIKAGKYYYLYKDKSLILKFKKSPNEKCPLELIEYAKANSLKKREYIKLANLFKCCRDYNCDKDSNGIKQYIRSIKIDDYLFVADLLKKCRCGQNVLNILSGYYKDELKNRYEIETKEIISKDFIHWYNLCFVIFVRKYMNSIPFNYCNEIILDEPLNTTTYLNIICNYEIWSFAEWYEDWHKKPLYMLNINSINEYMEYLNTKSDKDKKHSLRLNRGNKYKFGEWSNTLILYSDFNERLKMIKRILLCMYYSTCSIFIKKIILDTVDNYIHNKRNPFIYIDNAGIQLKYNHYFGMIDNNNSFYCDEIDNQIIFNIMQKIKRDIDNYR